MKTIKLNQGKEVLVDDDDYAEVSKYVWTYNPHGGGYASRTDRSGDKQRTVLMHRAILGAEKGEHVDHINRNRLDNRKENLRLCLPGENARNAGKRKDGITSVFKGVYRKKDKFAAHIQFEGNRRFLGYYLHELNAAYYYNVHAQKLHGQFAVLNDIPEDFVPSEPFSPDNARGVHSKYRGVTYAKRDKRYYANIRHKGKTIFIGSFLTDRLAAEMYNVYAIEIHGDKAILNEFEVLEGLIEK